MKYFIFLIIFCSLVFKADGKNQISHLENTCRPKQSSCRSALYKGIIAEETSGDYQTYLAIASTVRNRLSKGMTHGLVALKRKNLDKFVDKECAYALKVKKINLEKRAKSAIQEVFSSNKDYANGATHFEQTGKYNTPPWAKEMKIVKKLFPNTKAEITFYKVGAK
jgi:hypothetical protein